MKYLSFPMSARRFAFENPPGWTHWGENPEKIVNIARELDKDEWGGITLQRACGSLVQARWASNNTNGDPIQVYPAGPDDHPYPFDLGKQLQQLGFDVGFFAGWPLYASGFLAIEQAVDAGYLVFVDSSGGATNGHLVARMGAIVEPAPMPSKTPAWYGADTPVYMMADRADALTRLGTLPPESHIAWNGYEAGDSFYMPDEVRAYQDLGHHVHVPVGQTPFATELSADG